MGKKLIKLVEFKLLFSVEGKTQSTLKDHLITNQTIERRNKYKDKGKDKDKDKNHQNLNPIMITINTESIYLRNRNMLNNLIIIKDKRI
jgi:hypothetical protein